MRATGAKGGMAPHCGSSGPDFPRRSTIALGLLAAARAPLRRCSSAMPPAWSKCTCVAPAFRSTWRSRRRVRRANAGRARIDYRAVTIEVNEQTGELTDETARNLIKQQLAAFAKFITRHGGKRPCR